MNLLTVKMRSGEELVADVVEEAKEEDGTFYLLRNPVQLVSSGTGVSAREWLYFSDTNEVWLSARDILYINGASQEGAEYFDRILELRKRHDQSMAEEVEKFIDQNQSITEEDVREAEKIVAAYLEAQLNTKH